EQVNNLLKNIFLLVIPISYLAITLPNGFLFTYTNYYTALSIGKILVCIGAPLLITGLVIDIGKTTKVLQAKTSEKMLIKPISTTETITTNEIDPVEITTTIKSEEPKEIIEEQVEEDTFVETESYDKLFETGLYHIRNAEFDRAIEYWERCVKAKPDFLPGWNNLGLAYKDIEQIDKAINCWSKALEINPNYDEAAHNLEVALLLKRKRK
ncbi:MAG: tetratricopeptide repeat protein, partial [Candidatus Heimdallarchaeota archaeon]